MQVQSVENKLRRATRGQLTALNVIAKSPNSLATTSQIQDVLYSQVSNSTNTADQSVGGTISATSRIKVNNESLIIPMGKDEKYGIRWQLNENIIEKDKLKGIINEILQSWK